MKKFIKELNENQLKAVTNTEGYIRIVAGPGSGKTKTLASRYAYLVNECNILPENILCVTFTRKASDEMKERIKQYIGNFPLRYVCTYHSFCLKFLRDTIELYGFTNKFQIIYDYDSLKMVSKIANEKNLVNLKFSSKKVYEKIKKRKRNEQKYIELLFNSNNEKLKGLYKDAKYKDDILFYGYLYNQKKSNALTFDDLVYYTLYILKNNEKIRNIWQNKFCYIMVDEFQDATEEENEIVDILSSYHKNLFVVGDDDQNIYIWRGSNHGFLTDFDKNHINTKTITLNQNYRSTQNIVNAANSLIQNNAKRIDKSLFTLNAKGDKAEFYFGEDEKNEAKFVTDKITTLVKSGEKYKDMAILYRNNAQSKYIEDALIKSNIPYQIIGDKSFYEFEEIKVALSYLSFLINGDDESFEFIINKPSRKFGKKSMAILKKYAECNNCSLFDSLVANIYAGNFKNNHKIKGFISLTHTELSQIETKKASDLIDDLIKNSGYYSYLFDNEATEQIENINELIASAVEYENKNCDSSVFDYYDDLTHLLNKKNEDNNSIKLMTIHSSKGMEFENVFIAGANNGCIPSSKCKNIEQLEEERRVMYVAITRAKQRLFISASKGKKIRKFDNHPSSFIVEIGRENLTLNVKDPNEFWDDLCNYYNYMNFKPEFQCYDYVYHTKYGKGEIKFVDIKNKLYEIQFKNSKHVVISFADEMLSRVGDVN